MDNKLKVVHFVTAIDRSLGGVSMYMQLLAKELGKLVDLIVVTRPTANPLPLENCRLLYLPLPVSELRYFREKWKRILDEEKPDVVHVNGIWMLQTWIVQREALKRGITTYITPHGMLEPWILKTNPMKKKAALWLYEKKALRMAKALVATAESEKGNILRLGYNNRVEMIPNGIDLERVDLKTDWTVKRKILYMSRLHLKKGIELLLDSLAAIQDRLQGYEVIVAGEGSEDYVKELRTKAARLESIKVSFVGGVYGESKWELYRSCDFFVLPSYSENFGYVVAESLACGTPVITTKGTPWGDLEAFSCGCWVERDAGTLAGAILRMAESGAGGLQAMGQNGRRLVESKYTSAKMAESLYKLYLS